MAQKPKFNEQILMPLDSPLSATQLSLIPVSFLGAQRHFAVCSSIFSAAYGQGRSHFHLGRLGLSQLEHPLSGLSALSLAFVWHDRVAERPCQVPTRCSSCCGLRSAQDQRVPYQVLDSDPPSSARLAFACTPPAA